MQRSDCDRLCAEARFFADAVNNRSATKRGSEGRQLMGWLWAQPSRELRKGEVVRAAKLFEITLDFLLRVSNARPAASFRHLWKDLSFEGVDVLKERLVDYGNKEYKTTALIFALVRPPVLVLLEALSRRWPSLSPVAPDTLDSLDHTGDLVEVHMAALRASEYFQGEHGLLGEQYAHEFSRFSRIMQSVHVLDAVLRTGWVKYSQTKISTLSLKDLPSEAVPFEIGRASCRERV